MNPLKIHKLHVFEIQLCLCYQFHSFLRFLHITNIENCHVNIQNGIGSVAPVTKHRAMKMCKVEEVCHSDTDSRAH